MDRPVGTVLITGSRGFIGGYSGSAFVESGWRVVTINRPAEVGPERDGGEGIDGQHWVDLRETAEVERILRLERPTHCLHCAAPSSVFLSLQYPREDLEGHVLPTVSLFEAIRSSGLDVAVLVVSSAAVYGEPHRLPIREGDSLSPISAYGHHKVIQERLAREYGELYGVKTCIARVFSTYGPGLRRLAVWEITRRALAGDRTVFGTGTETRDFLHIRDVARALETICQGAPFEGEIFNVAAGEETEMGRLVALLYRALEIGAEPSFSGQPEAGKPTRWLADVGFLRGLGFSPRIPLVRGLEETVEWIARQGVMY